MAAESSKAPRGLLRSSAVVGVMTLLSRVLGLLRDMAMAYVLGANSGADAFFVAFKVPNFLRRLFAEGAFAQAFVPVLSEYRETRPHEAVQALVDRVAGVLGGTLLLLTGITVIGAPYLVYLIAPGFSALPEKLALTGELLQITFPYLFFISLTGFAGGILNSYGRFAVPAVTPVLLNLSLIVATMLVAPLLEQPAFALAWGVFAAGALQMLFQLPFLRRLQLMPRPRWDHRHPGVARILKLMIPALFGVSVSQINLLLDTILASFLPTGSVSWLYYSDRLTELPLGVFGIAIATVILPSLSRLQAGQQPAAFSATLDWALRMVLLIALPAMLALLLLASPILTTLFQYGAMNSHDVVMASLSLCAYALGLPAFMLVKVLAPGFYARQDLRTPVRFGVWAMVSNMVLNVVLVVPLHHYWQIGHVGLALATALSSALNAFWLWRLLARERVWSMSPAWRLWLPAIVAGCSLLVFTVWWLLPPLAVWQSAGALLRVLYLGGLCVAGLLAYLMGLWLFGLRPAHLRAGRSADS